MKKRLLVINFGNNIAIVQNTSCHCFSTPSLHCFRLIPKPNEKNAAMSD